MKRIFSIFLFFLTTTAFAQLSIEEKVNNKSCPSIFGAWGAILVNRPELTHAEMLAYHDLFWSPGFGLLWEITDGRVHLVGDTDTYKNASHCISFILSIRGYSLSSIVDIPRRCNIFQEDLAV